MEAFNGGRRAVAELFAYDLLTGGVRWQWAMSTATARRTSSPGLARGGRT